MAATKKKAPKAAKQSSGQTINLWTKTAPPLSVDRSRWRLTLRRPARHLRDKPITDLTQTVAWSRDDTGRQGEIDLVQPQSLKMLELVQAGDYVQLEIADNWGSTFRPVWRMRVKDNPEVTGSTFLIQLPLGSDLEPAAKSKASFHYVADRHHRGGWTARQITIDVARRFHLPVGRLPAARHKMKSLTSKSSSPTDFITKAWGAEHNATGRRFNIDLSSGVVNVTELKEPRYTLMVGPGAIDFDVKMDKTGIVSAVKVTGTARKRGSRKTKHLKTQVVDKSRRRRYGYIVEEITAPKEYDTIPKLRQFGRQWLARQKRGNPSISFTITGVPWLDRGDVIHVVWPWEGINFITFVVSVQHNASGGSYTTDVTASLQDPWSSNTTTSAARKKKAGAAARRGRPSGARSENARAPKAGKHI